MKGFLKLQAIDFKHRLSLGHSVIRSDLVGGQGSFKGASDRTEFQRRLAQGMTTHTNDAVGGRSCLLQRVMR
ncbi:hypothetical protein GCM10008957_52120 [Deinococcus ruber]|uniref:Uncharacterized protein n=1 Tax=Deinococcus ruber TaxID=1848197 RepID=A0A918FG95_9DEIO|nr:hypothetical protein GCM10008957_52120 [Deinococcus ruber]